MHRNRYFHALPEWIQPHRAAQRARYVRGETGLRVIQRLVGQRVPFDPRNIRWTRTQTDSPVGLVPPHREKHGAVARGVSNFGRLLGRRHTRPQRPFEFQTGHDVAARQPSGLRIQQLKETIYLFWISAFLEDKPYPVAGLAAVVHYSGRYRRPIRRLNILGGVVREREKIAIARIATS